MTGIYDALGPEGLATYEVNFKASPPEFTRISKPPTALLVPGFVDLHIHGGFGVDVMDAQPPDYERWLNRLAKCGYEALLPTTVTASAEDIKRALANLPEHPMIKGFHLEGPFISPNYPGAQPKSAIAAPPAGESEWDEILDDPRLRLVTLAPELPGAVDLILRLQKRGVTVSMGHTDATYEEARQGFEFGMTHATHTFNAMRSLHHREAGALGYALSNDGMVTELIYDRLHVAREAAGLLLKCKPEDKVLAVSDGTRATGMPNGATLQMWGYDCIITRGSVRLANTNTLAGSAVSLLECFQNLAEDFGPEVAIRTCSLNPRKALGMTEPPQVWLEFDSDYQLIRRRGPGGELL